MPTLLSREQISKKSCHRFELKDQGLTQHKTERPCSILQLNFHETRNQLTIPCQIAANISKLMFCLINIKLYQYQQKFQNPTNYVLFYLIDMIWMDGINVNYIFL